MTACIRRPFAVWSSCRCATCEPRRRRTRKVAELGLLPPAPVEQAWATLDRLIAAGWTPTAIASAAGLSVRTIHNAITLDRRGHRVAFGRAIAHRIINHGPPTAGRIGAVGTTRRLQALSAIGWSLDAIATGTGLPVATVSVLRSGAVERTSPDKARRVAEFYSQHCMTVGPSTDARRRALAAGWAPPLAWDDIDDPDERPAEHVEPVDVDPVAVQRAIDGDPVTLTRAEQYEIIRTLTERGWSDAQIATRVHLAKHTIVRIRRRLGIESRWSA